MVTNNRHVFTPLKVKNDAETKRKLSLKLCHDILGYLPGHVTPIRGTDSVWLFRPTTRSEEMVGPLHSLQHHVYSPFGKDLRITEDILNQKMSVYLYNSEMTNFFVQEETLLMPELHVYYQVSIHFWNDVRNTLVESGSRLPSNTRGPHQFDQYFLKVHKILALIESISFLQSMKQS